MKIVVVLGCFVLLSAVPPAHADPELVIATRYLQAEGESRSHLYLYREDGKLLRQLTKDNSGQEKDPIFAPDGETIVFTRTVGEEDQIWTIEPLGKNLRRLEEAPAWYRETKMVPYFRGPEHGHGENDPAPRAKSPDGAVELVLEEVDEDEDDQVNGPGHGKHYQLHDLRKGTMTEFGKLPGFYGTTDLLHHRDDEQQHFLMEGKLRAAFFSLHLDSTEGTTVYALDLNGPRLVRLGANWSTPIPLPGQPAFLALNFQRYVPIPKSKKTANCIFIERWDASFKKIRYAQPGSAAIAYGFSMYRKGQNPEVLAVRKEEQ